MTDWAGACRTNYFRVRDRAAFLDLLELYDLDYDEPERGVFACFDRGAGSAPTRFDETGAEIEIFDEIAPHLAPDHVALFMMAGFQKRRSISSQSVAIHPSGERVWVDINSIVERAITAFGKEAIIDKRF